MEEFLASLDRLDSCAAILIALMQFVRPFGMDCVAIGELPRAGTSRLPSFFYSTWPKSWFDIYVDHNLSARDPLVAAALHSVIPFTWSELITDYEQWRLTDEHLKALDLVHEYGWTDGFAVPIHGPGDHHGVVSYAGTSKPLERPERAVLHNVSVRVYDRMRALHRQTMVDGEDDLPELTRNEQETLRLLASGRTDREIASELGVAERTVLYYVRSMRQKFGCQTRAQLTAHGVRTGIIS